MAGKLSPSGFSGLDKSLFCSECKVKTRIEYQAIYSNNDETYFAIVKCIDCNKLTFLQYGDVYRNEKKRPLIIGVQTSVELLHSYPIKSEVKIEDVPPKIAKSYLEGVRCLDANSPNGAVSMFRRALSQVCVKLKANPKDRLVDQIKVLSNDIRPTASEIKAWGNLGAHEDNTGKIIDVSMKQAESNKRFIERVFYVVYQHPAELNKLQKERS